MTVGKNHPATKLVERTQKTTDTPMHGLHNFPNFRIKTAYTVQRIDRPVVLPLSGFIL